MVKFLWGLFLLILIQPAVFSKTVVKNNHSTIRISSDFSTVSPGQEFTVMLKLVPTKGWHTYWINPGDSGLPLRLEWTLDEGVEVGEIQWPAPEKIITDGIVNYGYHGTTFFMMPTTVSEQVEKGKLQLKVKADWLVCKDVCLPESAELSLNLNVGSKSKPSNYLKDFRRARLSLPQPYAYDGYYKEGRNTLTLTFPREPGIDFEGVEFYPELQGVVDSTKQPKPVVGKETVEMTYNKQFNTPPAVLNGILKTKQDVFALQLGRHSKGNIVSLSLLKALLFAFLGGLILNVMPCVFPILSLKALSLIQSSDENNRTKEALLYGLGVLTSFWILAGLLMVARAGGSWVGWGFHLQQPAVVGALFFIMILAALMMVDLLKLPQWFHILNSNLATKGDSIQTQNKGLAAFFTGILATVVASPCTAPFMAPALGYGLTQPAVANVAIFTSLGLGMAAPFSLLMLFPTWHRFLPKPGRWMQTLKYGLAIPMVLTACWLLWVFSQQVPTVSTLILALTAVILSGVSVVLVNRSTSGRVWVLVLLAFVSLFWVGDKIGINTKFDDAEIGKALENGQRVFVDVTAAWCITCQINKKGALSSPKVLAAMKKVEVKKMVADWTNQDENITRYLASFNRNGVPLYVYYEPGKEARILPQLLTEDMLLELFSTE